VIEKQKERAAKFDDESDMSASQWCGMCRAVGLPCVVRCSPALCMCAVDAFVACGGGQDKSGHVRKETLIKIIKQDFGLTIDIEVRCVGVSVCRCVRVVTGRTWRHLAVLCPTETHFGDRHR